MSADSAARSRHDGLAAQLVLLRVASIGAQALIFLAVAWKCEPGDFGELVVIMAYAGVGATICAGGASQTALRVAHLIASNCRWEAPTLRLLVMSCMKRTGLVSSLVGFALLFNPSVTTLGMLAGVGLALAMSLSVCATGITVARGEAGVNQMTDLLLRLPLQAAGIAVVAGAGLMTGPTLAGIYALSTAAHGVVLLGRLPLRARGSRAMPKDMKRLLGRFTTSASANAVLFMLLSCLDVLLGSLLLPTTAIAPIGVAGRVTGALTALHGAVFDHHAAQYSHAVRRQVDREERRLAKLVAIQCSLLTVVFMVAAGIGVMLMPSDAPRTYLLAAAPLWILLSARLVAGAAGPAAALMTLRGLHLQLARVTAISAIIEASLILLLAKQLEATGLAIASGAGLVAYTWFAHTAARAYLVRVPRATASHSTAN